MNIEKKFEICARGLREYAKEAGFRDVIVGLSGGIDSSVVAVLCVHVFGAEHVHGVLMPGPYSSESSVSDARELAQRLHIDAQTISIREPYFAFQRAFLQETDEALSGSAAENTQARCRMVVLMALSNAHNYMLVNTGNKSEACMGYSTLYGDTAGAYAPIGCLYKTDVYEMAHYMNSDNFLRDVFSGKRDKVDEVDTADKIGEADTTGTANKTLAAPQERTADALIPANVLTKPPSAELSAGQEDEKALGMSYELLDKILIAHFECGHNSKQIAQRLSIEEAEVQRIINTAHAFAFKRAYEPPFPQDVIYDASYCDA